MVWYGLGLGAVAHACQMHDADSSLDQVFRKHVIGECRMGQREALAISAESIFEALQAGKSVDILGAVIIGDLLLDGLPLQKIDPVSLVFSDIQQRLQEQGVREVRRIPGSLSIQKSWLRGVVATNLRNGALVVDGPVDMRGTTFEQSVDFSRTVFLGPVDFSQSIMRYEGFFIGSYFAKEANFEQTAFGTHSRFHKAVFAGPTTFLRSRFRGLAEFLEVVFQQETSFSRTYFHMGTGFSGSHFHGLLDFSGALFEREVFFRFATFEQEAYFRRTTFRNDVDFTNAQFHGLQDFTKVLFEKEPNVSGTELDLSNQRLTGLQDPRIQIGLLVCLILFAALCIWGRRKG